MTGYRTFHFYIEVKSHATRQTLPPRVSPFDLRAFKFDRDKVVLTLDNDVQGCGH